MEIVGMTVCDFFPQELAAKFHEIDESENLAANVSIRIFEEAIRNIR